MNDKTEQDMDTTEDAPKGQDILVYGCDQVEKIASGEKAEFDDPTSTPVLMAWERVS